MKEADGQFEKTSQKFYKQKHQFPEDIAWKLQYMMDCIKKTAKPVEDLTETQRNVVKEFQGLSQPALVIIFNSIVNSILSPSLYSAFSKSCRIKLDGLMARWMNVQISFQDKEICFTNKSKVLKFPLQDLECHFVSDVEIELKYQGVRKLLIQFDCEASAKSVVAQISKLIDEQEKIRSQNKKEQQLLHLQNYQQSLKRDYVIESKSQDNTFLVHKTQPKIHIQLFLKGQFWNLLQISQLIATHKLWNSRVFEEKMYEDENKLLICERRWQASLFSMDRKTLTSVTLTKTSETTTTIEQKSYQSPATSSIIVSDIHIKIVIELLSPKIIKLSIDCLFNAKGYCSTSGSRSMLIDLFSDVMDIQEKYRKLKEKGKLGFIRRLASREREFGAEIEDGESEVRIPDHQDYREFNNSGEYKSKNDKETVDQQLNRYQPTVVEGEVYYSIASKGDDIGCLDNVKNNHNQASIKLPATEQTIENSSGQLSQVISKPSDLQVQQGPPGQKTKQQQYKSLRPKNYESKITPTYISLIKSDIFSTAYLKKHFNQEAIQKFNTQTPWYDPSIIIGKGVEYQVSKNNQLIFINHDLIKGQKDSLIYVIKQVGANLLSGKSVLNVSLPVDIFESRSLLERSAASFGCAPKYLKPVADADVYTQMKAVIGFLVSVSALQLIMLKPFNPILGQTFQAYIGGIPIAYQQISHHPPISSYYMKCDEFTVQGNLIAIANVSLNSGTGGNAGKMKIIMKNGNVFELSFFPGEISGLIYGKRKYSICQKAYVFQRKSKLVAEISAGKESEGLYEWKTLGKHNTAGDVIGGIFQVKDKFLADNPFEKSLMQHGGLKKSDIEEKKEMIWGIWFDSLHVGPELINKDKTAYPIEYCEEVLPSDSNFRLDILYHKLKDVPQSQAYKQQLENIQRNDRKIRKKGN